MHLKTCTGSHLALRLAWNKVKTNNNINIRGVRPFSARLKVCTEIVSLISLGRLLYACACIGAKKIGVGSV